jgi:hypothetical protein
MEYVEVPGLDENGLQAVQIYFFSCDYELQSNDKGGESGYEFCFKAVFQDCCGETPLQFHALARHPCCTAAIEPREIAHMVTSIQAGPITQSLDPFLHQVVPATLCGLQTITLYPATPGVVEETGQALAYTDQLAIEVTPSIALQREVYAVVQFVDWPSRVMVTAPFLVVVLDCAGDRFDGLEWGTGWSSTKVVTS